MIILRSGRSPFELYLLAACVLSGLSGLVAPASSAGAVSRLLPHWIVIIWSSGLVIGGSVSITGVLLRGVRSLLVERIGLIALAGFAVTYSAAAIAVAGLAATFASLFVAAFGAACVGRFWQIGRDLKRAEADAVRRTDSTGGAR